MKKIIFVITVGMSVFATSLSSAQANNVAVAQMSETGVVDFTVKSYKDMKYRLVAASLPERAYIAIKRESGEILYSEYVSKPGTYTKVFDLSNLADGNYAFVIETNNASTAKTFAIRTETTRSMTPISAK